MRNKAKNNFAKIDIRISNQYPTANTTHSRNEAEGEEKQTAKFFAPLFPIFFIVAFHAAENPFCLFYYDFGGGRRWGWDRGGGEKNFEVVVGQVYICKNLGGSSLKMQLEHLKSSKLNGLNFHYFGAVPHAHLL